MRDILVGVFFVAILALSLIALKRRRKKSEQDVIPGMPFKDKKGLL